jgi:hypothetical protein
MSRVQCFNARHILIGTHRGIDPVRHLLNISGSSRISWLHKLKNNRDRTTTRKSKDRSMTAKLAYLALLVPAEVISARNQYHWALDD